MEKTGTEQQMRAELAAHVASIEGMKVEWSCKDYADGWIPMLDGREAFAYQEETGCAIRVIITRRV